LTAGSFVFDFGKKLFKAVILSQIIQVAVALKMLKILISMPNGRLDGRQGIFNIMDERVTAGEIVKNEGVVGPKL